MVVGRPRMRRTIGDGVRLMLDFNQSQSTAGAVERIRRLHNTGFIGAGIEGNPGYNQDDTKLVVTQRGCRCQARAFGSFIGLGFSPFASRAAN